MASTVYETEISVAGLTTATGNVTFLSRRHCACTKRCDLTRFSSPEAALLLVSTKRSAASGNENGPDVALLLAIDRIFRFVFELNSVYMYFQCLQELTNSCYQIVSPEFYFLYIKGYCIFTKCCLRYFIKRTIKTPVFERPINVSNDKRSELRDYNKLR